MFDKFLPFITAYWFYSGVVMAQKFFFSEGSNLTKFNENPDKKGFVLLDDRMSNAQKSKNLLELYSIVITAVVVLLAVAVIIGFTNKKLVPVIVTVNPEGEARYVGTVSKALYNRNSIPENAKIKPVKDLIKYMYTVFSDSDAQNDYIRSAQALVQGTAVNQLDLFFQENNPFDDFGEQTQSVELQEPLKQTDRTYFINFTVVRKQKGYTLFSEDYTALVNIDYFESVPETNPLGIFITNFDIKKSR